MKNILSRANRAALRQFARSNVLLAFDYDGTLAPIVQVPERAVMRKTTRTLLEHLVTLYPCVVISGRAQRDALQRLHGLGLRSVLGNHGAEPGNASPQLAHRVSGWRALLESRLAGLGGVRVEDKTFSIAVHYRQAREKTKARRSILRAAAILEGARVIGGEQAINILPEGAAHKGIALERERVRLGCDTAVYVGDDETDEDVFRLDEPRRLLSVRVGRRPSSRAQYFIDDQREIDAFLRALIGLSKGSLSDADAAPCRLAAMRR
jgi:trehalose 6-phosphate phosphatase